MKTYFTNFACGNTHEITLQNNQKLRFYTIFNNTMYTGAVQASVCICPKHLDELTCICLRQIFGLRQPGVLVYIK